MINTKGNRNTRRIGYCIAQSMKHTGISLPHLLYGINKCFNSSYSIDNIEDILLGDMNDFVLLSQIMEICNLMSFEQFIRYFTYRYFGFHSFKYHRFIRLYRRFIEITNDKYISRNIYQLIEELK